MKMMNIAGTVPIPNHKIENGIQAIGGIGLKILITKEHNSSKGLYQPSKIPAGIAKTEANNKPANTLNNVLTVIVKSLPFWITIQAEFTTSTGLGKIYAENRFNTQVIKYQIIIIIIGKTHGMNLLS